MNLMTRLASVALAFLLVTSIGTASAQKAPKRSITKIAGDVYRFQNNFHFSVFYVTDEGVMVTDPINEGAAKWLKAEIKKRFNVIGGSSSAATDNGNGTVNVGGLGSSIVFSNVNGQAGSTQVGRNGTGILNITNGATVDGSAQSLAAIGRKTTATGTVNVTGLGSTWSTSELFIGTDVDFGTVTASGPGGNGTLNVANDGALFANNIVNGATGNIIGDGTITANIQNSGTIGPGNSPGLMSVIGDVDLLSGGTLALEIGGTVFDTGYDRLDVVGSTNVEAGSIFDIDFFGGFTAGLGDVFDVLVADNISVIDLGALIFDFNGALLGAGLAWQTSIVDGVRDSLRLSVVEADIPEPSTLPLFASLLLGIAGLRRARRRA